MEFLSGRRGSNPRPQPWQGCALPTELLPRLPLISDWGCKNKGIVIPTKFFFEFIYTEAYTACYPELQPGVCQYNDAATENSFRQSAKRSYRIPADKIRIQKN